MKVKLKKHKKSPAPRSTEQTKVKSTIEKLRKTRTYGVPIHVVYDRGYQQGADLASRIQKNKEKKPAPFITEQVRSRTNAEIIHKCKSGFLAEFCGDVNPIRPKLLKELIYSDYMCIVESFLGTTAAIEILEQLENVIKRYNLQYTPKLLKCVMQCVELKVISDRSCE